MRLLSGSPVDLTQRLPALDMLENTGSGEQPQAHPRLARPCPALHTHRAHLPKRFSERARMGDGSSTVAHSQTWRCAQCAGTVLMVRPHAFGFNADTAATNTFQHADRRA